MTGPCCWTLLTQRVRSACRVSVEMSPGVHAMFTFRRQRGQWLNRLHSGPVGFLQGKSLEFPMGAVASWKIAVRKN